MLNFKITETHGINDMCEAYEINVKSLSHAKTAASRGKCFQGTWLHVEDNNGNHLSRKNPQTKKWENTPN